MKLLNFSCLALGALAHDEKAHVLNNAGQIWRHAAGNDGLPWTLLNGILSDIGCNNNNQCWGVSIDGRTWYGDSSVNSFMHWVHVPADFKGVSVSSGQDGSVWVVDTNDYIWRAKDANSPWESVYGLLVDIAAVSYYEAWGVNRQGTLWHQAPTSKVGDWTPVDSAYFNQRVAVCDNGDVYLGIKDEADLKWGVGVVHLANPGNAERKWNVLDGGAYDVACKNDVVYAIGGNTGSGADPADHTIWVRGDWDPVRHTFWNIIAGGAVRLG